VADRDAFGNDPSGGAAVPGGTPAGASGLTPEPIPGATIPIPAPAGLPTAPSLGASATTPPQSGLPPVTFAGASANRAMTGRRRSNPFGLLISLIVAAAIIGIPVKLALDAKSKSDHTTTNPLSTPLAPSKGSSSSASPAPAPAKPSGPPTGVSTGSMVLAVPVAKAIVGLKGEGKVVEFRVSPANIQAQTLTTTGRERDIEDQYDGQVFTTITPSGGFGAQPSIPISKIDPTAPARILAHTHRHASGIDYLLLLKNPVTGTLQWEAFYTNSQHHFTADVHGHHVKFVD
jgi:hypothetical protein